MTDPLGHVSSYTYDARGNLASYTDADGRLITFSSDSDNRLITEDWHDAEGNLVDVLQFTYNSQGLLATASNDAGEYTFSYDSQGRLVRETEPYGDWLDFSYDTTGDTTVTDSTGGVTVSTYNAEGQLVSTQLSAPGSATIGVNIDYTDDGQVADEIRTSNGGIVGYTNNTYDASGNPTNIVELDADGDLIDSFAYTYNSDGQVTSETDDSSPGVVSTAPADNMTNVALALYIDSEPTPASSTTNYAYDASGQLIAAGSTTYSYDANGNRTSPGYKIGPDNQVLSDGTWNYTYDADGNRISETDPSTGITWNYTYDDANRLTSATEFNAAQHQIYKETFDYDVFGNQIEQSIWSAATTTPSVERYAFNGTQIWAAFDGNNNLTTRYLNGQDTAAPLARESADGTVGWYLTDRLGSVRDIVDNSGTILDHIDYDAYGNVVSQTNPAEGDQFQYAGMQFISVVGIYYDHARDYDPGTGTWTSQDPMGFDSGVTNTYTYVGNRPTQTTDPSGEIWGLGFAALGAGIGVAVYAGTTLLSGGEFSKGGFAGAATSGAIFGIGVGAFTGDPAAAGLAGALIVGSVAGGVSGAAGSVVQQGIDKGFSNIDGVQVANSTAGGMVGGAVGLGTLGNPAAATLGRVLASGTMGGAAGGAVQGGANAAANGQNIPVGMATGGAIGAAQGFAGALLAAPAVKMIPSKPTPQPLPPKPAPQFPDMTVVGNGSNYIAYFQGEKGGGGAAFKVSEAGEVSITMVETRTARPPLPPRSAGPGTANALNMIGTDKPPIIEMQNVVNQTTILQLADNVPVQNTLLGQTLTGIAESLGGHVVRMEVVFEGDSFNIRAYVEY